MRVPKGLTLIELLIVIVILGALAAIAVPRLNSASDNAKEKACQTNCDIISNEIEVYYLENDSYPSDITDVTEDPNRFPGGPPECPKGGSYYLNSENRAECDHSGGGPGC